MRIFTTLQEVDDKVILSRYLPYFPADDYDYYVLTNVYSFIAGFVLNSILFGQVLYYWNSPTSANHAAEVGKEPEKVVMGSRTGASTKAKSPTTRRRG